MKVNGERKKERKKEKRKKERKKGIIKQSKIREEKKKNLKT